MTGLQSLVESYVGNGSVPEAVGLVARGDRTEVAIGGTGTTAHITPSTGTVAILFTQVATDAPVSPEWMRDFWRYAAS